MEQRYAEATERMQAALRAAADLRTASAAEAAEAAEADRGLSEREAAIRRALALLSEKGQVSGR